MIYILIVILLLSTNIVFAADPEATIFHAPVFRYMDSNGRPLSGGTIEFYETGTLNAKLIYLNADMTSDATSVTLDARGEAVIYGGTSIGKYRVRIKDRNGIIIRTVEDVLVRAPSNYFLTLEDDTSAGAVQSTLGLGSAALLNASGMNGNVVTYDGDNTLPAANGSQLIHLTIADASSALPRGYISGFTLSNNSSTPNTKIDISAGSARDSGNTKNLSTSAVVTKDLTSDWGYGDDNGGLETGIGTLAVDTWYHVHAIGSSVTSNAATTDFIVSVTTEAPVYPSGFDTYRRIGCIKSATDATIMRFYQLGDHFFWDAPILTGSASGAVTAAATTTLTLSTIPPIDTIVEMNTVFSLVGSGAPGFYFFTIGQNPLIPWDARGVRGDINNLAKVMENPEYIGPDAYQWQEDNVAGYGNFTKLVRDQTLYVRTTDDTAYVMVWPLSWIDNRGKD